MFFVIFSERFGASQRVDNQSNRLEFVRKLALFRHHFMNNSPETRSSLLIRLADPTDDQAWQEFVEIYEPVILQLARRRGAQEADAMDLVQSVMGKIATLASTWDADPARGSFRGWLAVTTKRLVIDLFRQQQRQPRSLTEADYDQLVQPELTDQEFDLQQRRELFTWCANTCRLEFSDRTWQAFWRTSVDQRAIDEVAAELKVTKGAVYIARSRVMARLRALVQQSQFDSTTWEAEI